MVTAFVHPEWIAFGAHRRDDLYYVYASRDVHRLNIDPVVIHEPIPLDAYNLAAREKVSGVRVKGWVGELVIGAGESYAEAFAVIDAHFARQNNEAGYEGRSLMSPTPELAEPSTECCLCHQQIPASQWDEHTDRCETEHGV